MLDAFPEGLIRTSQAKMKSNTSALHTTALLAGVLVTLGFLLYRAALPKPIPGIPCARYSINRLFGDVPDALKYHAKTSETVVFLASRCEELKSLCGRFLGPGLYSLIAASKYDGATHSDKFGEPEMLIAQVPGYNGPQDSRVPSLWLSQRSARGCCT